MRTSSPMLVIPQLKPIAIAVAWALAAPCTALAAPIGHTVVAGDVRVTQPDARSMIIQQGSDKAILNWQGFSIGAGESVRFVQPSSSSVALNRVTGGAPSEIFGRLSANGKVFLVNPAGVMFGRGASVDVGGLVASTLDLADDDFLAGRYAFHGGGDGTGSVRNAGTLAAGERGTIALLGGQVSNDGTITARLGTVALAAGGKVTLDFNGDGLTRIVVDAARINALVENGGAIISEGGQVTMTAHAAGAIADTVVRQQGVVQATSLLERDGRIVLDGGARGKVELAGTLDAGGRAAGQRGGAVTVQGSDIALAPASVIDASGDAGGGSVLVGGDYRGGNPQIRHAASTSMAAGAAIRADALGNGDGGKVVLWSDGSTAVHGSASARGGAQGGNGGTVETSGRTLDVGGMLVAAGAAKGRAGTWLLDPYDITIDAQYAASISNTLNNSTNVTVTTRGGDGDGDGEALGDIWVEASIAKTAGGDATLLLEAENDIIVESGVIISSSFNAGKLNVDFSADADASGGGGVVLEASRIVTNGGDVRIYGQDDPVAGRARAAGEFGPGVVLYQSTIDTRRGGADASPSGKIAIAGQAMSGMQLDESLGGGMGVLLVDSSLHSGSGDITISGTGGTVDPGDGSSVNGGGVAITLTGGSRISTGTGAVTISGSTGTTASGPAVVAGVGIHIGDGSAISTTAGAINLSGTGAPGGGAGVDVTVGDGEILGGGAVSMSGTGGVRLSMNAGLVSAGSVLTLDGRGGPDTDGVALALDTSLIEAGSVSIIGSGGSNGNGISLSLDSSTIRASAAGLALTGTGGHNGAGAVIDLHRSSLQVPDLAIEGIGGSNGAGVSGTLNESAITASTGSLAIDGSGGFGAAGVDIFMSDTEARATQGDVLISGEGGSASGAGVVISSFDAEAGVDESYAESRIMTGSGAYFVAGRNLRISGVNGEGGAADAPATVVAGVDMTGIALFSHGGGMEIIGGGLAGNNVIPAGVSLTNVMAIPSTPDFSAGGTVRILAGAADNTPALILDGTRLGDWRTGGDVIIGARNTGAGPVFAYPGASGWVNSVATPGVINLRPDDGGLDYGGVVASTLPISVGPGGSGFNVDLTALGIWNSESTHVVVGSQQHTGRITYADPREFGGNLTLQNGGAGSQGILIASNMVVRDQLTLSSGGAVSAPGSWLDASAVLLHGTQPESSFLLDSADNITDRVAFHFDQPASGARPEHGDVSFRSSGELLLGGLRGAGYTTAGNQPTEITGNNTVAGDLLLQTSGKLTLAQEAGTLGGDITLVTGDVFDAASFALAPGATRTWRVFADTWVGENRGGLTPAAFRPNYYNCAYGDACAGAIAGNRFVYRAQPILTMTADNLARTYGSQDPPLVFTFTGLVNDDSFEDSIDGHATTTATPSSNAGVYPITGTYTSPVGYAIDLRPGIFTINPAALLVTADSKSKVYGAADPLLTATYSGLVNGDAASVVNGLTLSAPTGAQATAGTHAIVAANGAAANYTISYQPGVLTVDRAVLTYVADPTVRPQGSAGPLSGSVTGFAYSDTLAGATTGALEFATLAPAAAPGVYAVEGRGLSAANYSFVQAASNATALTTVPVQVEERPSMTRDITFESSNVYEKNFGTPRLCVGTGPLGAGASGGEGNDPLALEWSRVRVSPNLSNCLGLGQRNSCQDF